MDDIILKVEDIHKQYRLGVVGTGTISNDLKRWWFRIRGREDPFLKVGETNDRSTISTSDYVWALQDINFEVKRGEVLGIIGKNGAGKSTLLKILARVTAPTTGTVKTKGRIASLLEVGTGFHPEMTGRENILLNGAILGMTKDEIKNKEEEIIEFSGCHRYIDTPVKRYSSGMRVRLAFAVAAHLEPDILVVDEVLAVGDAEFQKKAIGKMQDISKGQGRTVLFVSHNMAAVQDLCTRAILLSDGKIIKSGQVLNVVNQYLSLNDDLVSSVAFNTNDSVKTKIKNFQILDENEEKTTHFSSGEIMVFKVHIDVKDQLFNPIFSLRISDISNVNIITWRSNDLVRSPFQNVISNSFSFSIETTDLYLLDGLYNISISFLDGKEVLDFKENFIQFEIFPSKPSSEYYSITKQKSSNSLIFNPVVWNVD